MLPFLQSELCALEDLRVVDPHTCHARFVSEAGCKCARHQSQHMLFTPESKLLAFEVLTGQRYRAAARKDPDRSAGAAESARDLYVRWATATPPGEESSRLATLRAYLGSYSQAAHLHAAVPRGVPEYGFLSFSSGVARDAVLALEELVIDGKPVLVRPIHTKPEKQRRPDWPGGAHTEPAKPRKSWPPADAFYGGPPPAPPPATYRAAQESEIPNFKGSDLGHFPLVSADFWTSDHLSERPRRVDAFLVTRARGTLTLKRR